ncbi:cyclophilin-like fold protein [Pseudomonas sp. NFACC36]|uniref:cyclophilin-like fold protein n=1 Tax=Pseudomonas sp. NFACC36 TaxID=1566197 RepID=UPI000CDEB78E|nr:cyclophilin-like fold protein [Pseudomonas sp. NFACC36]
MKGSRRCGLSVVLTLASHLAMNGAAAAASTMEKPDMWMTVGEQRFAITLADNTAARAFVASLPLTLDMSDLNRNEKYATLPQAFPAQESKPGAIRNGDLMLYGTDTLVLFYLDFQTSYAYTRLGRVEDTAKLAQALGRRGVQVTFHRNR